jgi:hypothetical protein
MGAVRSLEAEGAAERATLTQLATELQEALGEKEVAQGRVEEAGHKVRVGALEHLIERLPAHPVLRLAPCQPICLLWFVGV